MADSQSSLLEQIRSGNRRLQLLAADGVLPLPPEELIPLQVELARGTDQEVSDRARDNLLKVDPRLLRPFLERAAREPVLAFFAEEARNPQILEAILRRRDTPRRILAWLARRVPPDLQELLLLRQDAIVEEPAILQALEENPQVSIYSQRRIAEYREHLLPRQRTPLPAEAELLEEMDDEEFEEALAVVREAPSHR